MSVRVYTKGVFGSAELFVESIQLDEVLLCSDSNYARAWPSAYEARLDLGDFPGSPFYGKFGYVYEELP